MSPIRLLPIVIIAFSLSFASGCKAPAKPAALIVSLSGTVEVIDGGAWMPAKKGQQLSEAAELRTGADGQVDLQVPGRAGIRLLGGSLFKIKTLSDSAAQLAIEQGDILVRSARLRGGEQLSVETPTAIAAVRGTQFWGQVKPQDKSGIFAVREGSVEVTIKASGARHTVEAGQALPYAADGSASARGAAEPELAAMQQLDQVKVD